MLTGYTNQSITKKTKGAVNAYNEATYASSTIKGRFEYKRNLVRDVNGEEVVSSAVLYTETDVNPDDIINYDSRDYPVINVEDVVGLNGTVEFYQVFL